MAQATQQPKLRLWPKSATAFFLRAVDASVTLEQDEEGKVVARALRLGDRALHRAPVLRAQTV